jgi:hypothetical protein
MGFSGIPPRADLATAIAAINLWSLRADAAIVSEEPPWDSLLTGVPAESLVVRDKKGLVEYYRSKGLAIWVYLDPENGLNRSSDSDPLVKRGRSMTEPEIQAVYRRYAVVLDSILSPEHFGLALETNLIRGAAPDSLYRGVKAAANAAAGDIRSRNSDVRLSVSVQADYAWGRLGGGQYVGVEQDFSDFPFIQELGISSYPYLAGFSEPENIADEYYSRLKGGRSIPLMVTEGGWTSESLDSIHSSPDKQKRYIERQMALLDTAGAIAVFQLTFTDLDLAAITLPPGSILPLFAHLGLVDANLNPKPSLAAWDGHFAIRRN